MEDAVIDPNRDLDRDPVSAFSDRRGSQEKALDAAVPMRTHPRSVSVKSDGLDDRAALVLLHADGVSSIAEIASETKLPISDAIATILELVWKGLVELTPETPAQAH
jgi:hypothetical protein